MESHGWLFESLKQPISNSNVLKKYTLFISILCIINRLSEDLDLFNTPEMVYNENYIKISNKSLNINISFNAHDAIKVFLLSLKIIILLI